MGGTSERFGRGEKGRKKKNSRSRSSHSISLLEEKRNKLEQTKKTRHHAPDRVHQDARDPQRCVDRGQGAQGPRQGPARYGSRELWRRKGCLRSRAKRQRRRRRRPDRRRRAKQSRDQRSLFRSLAAFQSPALTNCGSRSSLLLAALATCCSVERMQARVSRSK